MVQHVHTRTVTLLFVCFYFCVTAPTAAAAATTAYSIKTIKSTNEANLDKSQNEFVKLTSENLVRTNQKPCKNLSVDDYLSAKTHSHKIVNIDHLKANGTSKFTTVETNSNHLNRTPIFIDIKHDLFDVNYGLVPNIMYTGMSREKKKFEWTIDSKLDICIVIDRCKLSISEEVSM